MECELCEELNQKENLIFETEYWVVLLAFDQEYLGRCRIIFKKHTGDLAKLNNDEWLELLNVIQKIEKAIKKSFNPELFNISCLMNNAYKKEPFSPHIHWHLKPRYKNKIEFAGEIADNLFFSAENDKSFSAFEDAEFGKHYKLGTNRELSSKITNKIISKIKENL